MVRWARRFARGTVRLQGELVAGPLSGDVHSPGGTIELAFRFRGGEEPQIVELAIVGPVAVGEREGSALDADARGIELDGNEVGGPTRLDLLAHAVVSRLCDVAAHVEVVPEGELVVRFPHGVEAQLHANVLVTLQGAASGPPGALTLSEPVTMAVDGEGLRLSHRRFRKLSSLASLRLEGASLQPDGEVRLEGGAASALDRVVRGGLDRASARLSALVRESPRFARVRSFLKPGRR